MSKKGNDYIISLGLDTSKLEKQYKGVYKKLQDQTEKISKAEKRTVELTAKKIALQEKDIALAKRRVTLERQISAAENRGATGFGNIRSLAGKGDKLSVAKAELAAKEKILLFDKKKLAVDKQITAEKNAQLAASKKAAAEEKAQNDINKRGRLEVKAYEEDSIRNRKKQEALAKTEEAARQKALKMRRLEIRAYEEDARRTRAQQKANARANADPLAASERSKRDFSARVGHELNKQYSPDMLPALSSRINAAKNSMKRLQIEISQATKSSELVVLRRRFSEINQEIRSAVGEQRKLNRQLEKGSAAGAKFGGSLKHMALQFASIYTIVEGAKSIYRIGKDFESMQAGLLAASDSADEAKKNFDFLMDTSQRLGTDVESGVRGFNRLGVAMKGVGYSAEDIKEAYLGIQEATATFQLSTEKSNLVMLAMSQMASCTKVPAPLYSNVH